MKTARKITVAQLRKTGAAFALGFFLLQPAASSARDAGDNWRNLSPKDRENIQRNYQHWQNLPPKDKEHLREEWNRWQSLPQDRRDQLRDRYEDMRRRRQQK
jgi:hypothetical protein